MLDPDLTGSVEATVRGVAAAVRALRLYPPTSPIPRQSVEGAVTSLASFLETQPSLPLDVAREGFTCRGTALSSGIGGGNELADMLRSHGVAQVQFLSGCDDTQMLAFLGVVMHAPETVRADGGIAAMLAAAGVGAIRVVTVSLTVAGTIDEPVEGQDVDDFFHDLGSDPEKLSMWLAAAAAGDPATLAEGLDELERAAGADRERFLANLAVAFGRQETDAKDVLLGIGMDPGGPRDVVGSMLGHLEGPDISSSLTGGLYGKNMLSLSAAITRLPLGARLEEVIAEVRASLPAYGRDEREIGFLDRMMSVRMDPTPEPALAISDGTYAAVAAAAVLDAGAVEAKRAEVGREIAHTAAHSVPTMLALLDQQRDFGLYVRTLDALASTLPRLVREGDIRLAVTVLEQISDRENRTTQPWPELTQRLRAALARATGRETMSALLDTMTTQPEQATAAIQAVLRFTDDAGKASFVEESLARREDVALDLAQSLLGRRFVEILAAAVPRVGPSQLGVLVRRLAMQGDETASQAVAAASRRQEEMARVEVADGLSGTTNAGMVRHLAGLLGDPSPKVVLAAAKSLARTRLPGTAETLAARLEALDVDGRDFALGRELIACLAQMPEPAAAHALSRLADRKALIKRGRFLEVQQLAREAVAVQARKSAL